MPEKLYTASDMGGGLQVVNSPDPINPQDLATKNHVDTYRNQFGPYVPLWETSYNMQCTGNVNATNGSIHITTGPTDQSITRLYPDTAIRVIGTMSFYINTVGSQIYLQCNVNGGAKVQICGLFQSTISEHTSFPVGIYYFSPSYLGSVTGAMTVAWYMNVSSAVTTVITDTGDSAQWTIAECKVTY